MISYKDILHSITPILSNEFDIDVYDEPKQGVFEDRCFYVTLVPTTNQASTRYTNSKSLMASIKYFGGSKLENYDIADRLEGLFTRVLKVKDRYIGISNIEPNFLSDEVGDMLDFLIYLEYSDHINVTFDGYDLMQDINMEIR